jgi:hypothetical protein
MNGGCIYVLRFASNAFCVTGLHLLLEAGLAVKNTAGNLSLGLEPVVGDSLIPFSYVCCTREEISGGLKEARQMAHAASPPAGSGMTRRPLEWCGLPSGRLRWVRDLPSYRL